MSTRLAQGGRLIDRKKALEFTWNNKRLRGYAGDTLASALLANGEMMVGRSFKYHRPRGIVASGPEEPNALVGLREGAHFEPNQRASTTALYDGLSAKPQNAWPSLQFDMNAINAKLSRFLPAGFYYKTFIHPRAFWKHLFEPIIRRAAGLGEAPKSPDPDRYEHFYAHVDMLIVGGGIAGLGAALTAGRAGAKVLLIEQNPHWGGRAGIDGVQIDNQPADQWVKSALAELQAMPNMRLRINTMGAGCYDHGYAIAYERVSDCAPDNAPRHRLWRIRAKQIISATGAIERPLSFANNDVPGVMLASALRDYLENHAVSCGDVMVLATNNDDAYRSAIAQIKAGLSVAAIVDARATADGDLCDQARALGIRVLTGKGIACVKGNKRVSAIEICQQAGEGSVIEEIPCDVVAMSGGW